MIDSGIEVARGCRQLEKATKVMVDRTDLPKEDTLPLLHKVQRSGTYSVYSCEGFATSFLKSADDAVLQFSFWMKDITPDSEDLSRNIGDVSRYTTSVKNTFCTAVKLNPNTALQLALNILENLESLPHNIKRRYNIPPKMKNIPEN